MKDDIRKFVPDLETVLQKTDPDKLKARRDQAFEQINTKPEEPAPVEVPPKSGEVKETQAPAAAPPREKLPRRTIVAAVIAILVVAPLVVAAVVARLKPAEKTGERAAATGAPAASSSSIEERPAASAVPSVSATAPVPAATQADAAGRAPLPSADASVRRKPIVRPVPSGQTLSPDLWQ